MGSSPFVYSSFLPLVMKQFPRPKGGEKSPFFQGQKKGQMSAKDVPPLLKIEFKIKWKRCMQNANLSSLPLYLLPIPPTAPQIYRFLSPCTVADVSRGRHLTPKVRYQDGNSLCWALQLEDLVRPRLELNMQAMEPACRWKGSSPHPSPRTTLDSEPLTLNFSWGLVITKYFLSSSEMNYGCTTPTNPHILLYLVFHCDFSSCQLSKPH